MNEKYQACEKFVTWLKEQVVYDARGDQLHELPDTNSPRGKFWLGRIASEEYVRQHLGDRGDRLDPCAIGYRLKVPSSSANFTVDVRFHIWFKDASIWKKSSQILFEGSISLDEEFERKDFFEDALTELIRSTTGTQHQAKITIEREGIEDSIVLIVSLVNTTPHNDDREVDSNLYQAYLSTNGIETIPFYLESLPDSFRYDRAVNGYGLNSGIRTQPKSCETLDYISAIKNRPEFSSSFPKGLKFTFLELSTNPISLCESMISSLNDWGETHWSDSNLQTLAEKNRWSHEMLRQASEERDSFWEEVDRIKSGVQLLKRDENLNRSFCLMNESFYRSSTLASGKAYDSWRPFQLGFILANIASVLTDESVSERDIADIVWFATGGGKTETYLGLIVVAALYDRLRGKKVGVTAWSRFPLRMLSLQQTQRFANALASAEVIRQKAQIPGQPFSLGFLVGRAGTPNSIKPEPNQYEPDPDDPNMPKRFRLLQVCPFCRSADIHMVFDKESWTLRHMCGAEGCEWGAKPLPFYVVDEEVFRFLPTVVVGTLDKAALISMQGAMVGLVASPTAMCEMQGHGFTYAPRAKRPSGCLVPGCRAATKPIPMDRSLFGPTYRLQDELHLLKDSLGAVDAHYEAIYDFLQHRLSGSSSKILASSATLSGYMKQVDVLYRRNARVFPIQGPEAGIGFWSAQSDELMRDYVALAPRGVTMEFATDCISSSLQRAIRQFMQDSKQICGELEIDDKYADFLVSVYGTNVIYGNNIKDLDAVARSLETQMRVEGRVNTSSLTGRTDFESVKETLDRLETPEESFENRLHVITASSMMSHGVDIDRLNIMVMLGVPLTTSEFIQATARVGRTWPGVVFVFHRMARERDAGIFRSFDKYVEQGDRFVEPIPITRRSRKVLERTLAGMQLARVLCEHEPNSGKALTKVSSLRAYMRTQAITAEVEAHEIIEMLQLEGALDEPLVRDVVEWMNTYFANLNDPGGTYRFPSDLCPTRPMLSLRDVEEQAPVIGSLFS